MNLKADTEYIFKTGHTISDDGTIPLKQMQEIVRCKDCVCAEKFPYEENVFTCTHPQWRSSEYGVYGEDYCSYGERRDEA